MKVKLSNTETLHAAQAGVMRQLAALRKGIPDQYGFNGDGWGAHIEGCAAEYAVAKALGRHWHPSASGPSYEGDVAGEIEVRWTSYETGCLLLHDKDPDERRYYLVTGSIPDLNVVGWIRGTDGKQARYWREASPSVRHPAFFVPQDALVCEMTS